MSKTIENPTTIEAITAEWLTEVLQSTGVLGETAVTAITVEPLCGAGYIGQIARLTLSYDSGRDKAPASLIAKFSHPDPDLRQGVKELYLREVRVYQELIDEIDLPAPRCYYSDVDTESGHAILLLEDLAHLRRGDIAQGCDVGDAETVVTHFARHHAQWWQDPLLDEIDYLRHDNTVDPEWAETYQEWWSHFEEKVTALLPDCFLPASFLDVGCRTAHQLQEINNQTADTPFTLRHSDSHLDNLMFAHNEEGPPLTVIDWQCCGGGPGVSDIGYFLIFSMPVCLRRESEHRLLHLYHETLVAYGVTNYSFDQCWRDYRLAFFKNLITAVVVVNLLDLTRPHGRAFLQVMIPRLASFAEDHCVSDLL